MDERSFVAGSLLFVVIGTKRCLSVGADSTIAPVLATGVASVAVIGTSIYGVVMALAALVVGVVLIAIGSLRLGWISDFLSTPVITGLLAGIAIEIVVRQLPVILGLFAVDASPPNTAILAASGARSQLANLVAVVVAVVVLLVATAPLAKLPEATLGATLIFIASRLFRVGDLRTILRFDRLEFTLAAVTLLAIALIGIEQGVALAMILSLAERTWRSARPRDTVLGREPGTDGYASESTVGLSIRSELGHIDTRTRVTQEGI